MGDSVIAYRALPSHNILIPSESLSHTLTLLINPSLATFPQIYLHPSPCLDLFAPNIPPSSFSLYTTIYPHPRQHLPSSSSFLAPGNTPSQTHNTKELGLGFLCERNIKTFLDIDYLVQYNFPNFINLSVNLIISLFFITEYNPAMYISLSIC